MRQQLSTCLIVVFVMLGLLLLWTPVLAEPGDVIIPDIRITPKGVQGRYLYGMHGHTLMILDIATPTAPVILGEVEVTYDGVDGWPKGMKVQGDYAYIVTTHRWYDDTGFPAYNRWLLVFDISDPVRPHRVGRLLLPKGISHFTIHGNYIYVVARNPTVIDISDPFDPQFVSFGAVNPRKEGILDYPYAFVNNPGKSEVAVYDFSDPLALNRVGFLDLNYSLGLGWALKYNNYLYALSNIECHVYDCTTGYYVIDVSDVTAPRVANFIDHQSNDYGEIDFRPEILGDRYMYTLLARHTLLVWSLRDPLNPSVALRIDLSPYREMIEHILFYADGYLYGEAKRSRMFIIPTVRAHQQYLSLITR